MRLRPTFSSSRMSSLMIECSAPSMGIWTARPPTATRMCFACNAKLLDEQLPIPSPYTLVLDRTLHRSPANC